MVKKTNCLAAGFTLIELLMVVAIVGVLAGAALVTFPSSQKRSRDAKRMSDLKQYQTALENFANQNNGFYPSRTALDGQPASDVNTPLPDNGVSLCDDVDLDVTDDVDCSPDPKEGQDVCGNSQTCQYLFQTNGSSLGKVDATRFVVWATLEETTDSGITRYAAVCSSGKSGIVSAGLPPPSVNRGACPL